MEVNGYQNLISRLSTKNKAELEAIVLNKIPVNWFSKFSNCIPESLAKETILDMDYDLAGTMRELAAIKIDYPPGQ